MGGKIVKHAKISRKEVEKIAESVAFWLEACVEIGGSYARGIEESGDVDLLVSGDVDEYKEKLIAKWGRYKNGNPKRTGEINGVQVDLMFAPKDYYGASLLAIRGCGEFNVGMRSLAKKQGYLLNQYGLWDRDKSKRFAGDTEKSIFNKLGMQYVKPEHRTGIEVVMKAKKGTYKSWAIEQENI